jgi:hypothetical protein
MSIIGVDYHPGFQQIALVDTDTGELQSGGWRSGRKRFPVLCLCGQCPVISAGRLLPYRCWLA